MRQATLIACLVALAASTNAEWAWGGSNSEQTTNSPSAAESAHLTKAVFLDSVAQNSTNVDSIIDTIVRSGREGRTLGEDAYQQVASEPAFKRALASGDDAQARQFVKDRLCHLGLMTCGDDIQSKGGPSVQPHEVFYAQPVAIKPIGHPIPAIPVRNPHAYKQPFQGPVPPPPGHNGGFNHGPINSGGFNSGFGSGGGFNSGPINSGGFNSGGYPRPGGYPNFKRPPPINGGIYGPPKPVPFETDDFSYNKKSQHKEFVGGVNGGINGATQHIHHHYHHGGAGGVGAGSIGPSVGVYPGFSKAPPAPVYEPEYEGDDQAGYGSNAEYGNAPFYKKELNLNQNQIKKQLTGSAATNLNSYAGQYQGYESPRSDNCYCVPIEQCPAHEVIGRKEDNTGYLIDPRNVATGIEAEDGVIELVEASDLVKREDADAKNATVAANSTVNSTAEVTRTKRQADTKDIKAQSVAGERKGRNGKDSPDAVEEMEALLADKESERSLDGGTDDFGEQTAPSEPQLKTFGHSDKVRPTFGVSFGLPYGYGQPYPLNPFGSVPSAVNPFFGSVGPGGLSLGPVSVNPLLSIQVSKDEFGEKIIKPLVNLHVTPNKGLLHKFKGLVGGLGHGGFGGGGFGGGGFGGGGFHHGPPPIHHLHHGEIHHNHPPPPFILPGHPPPPPPYGPGNFGPRPYGPRPFGPGPYGPGPYNNKGHNDEHYDDDDDDDEFVYPSSGRERDDGPPVRRPQQPLRSQYAPQYSSAQNYQPQYSDSSNYDTPARPQYSDAYKYQSKINNENSYDRPSSSSKTIKFPRAKREANIEVVERQFGNNYIGSGSQNKCNARQVCCRNPGRPAYAPVQNTGYPQCGRRNAQGINGRIKNPVYADGDSEFGEYPWQAAILKKDAHESVYVCGGTLIDNQHVITAAHCVKGYSGQELRVRLGEWDVNHDVEFYPYIETDVSRVTIHPEFYAGTLFNDLAVIKLVRPVDLQRNPHISAACLPDPHTEFAGSRCYTTGWGKDAFGDFGKYQNILKEVDVPVVSHHQCQSQLQQTRLGYDFKLHPGFVCAGGEEGKDACKGDGGGPMVCERGGSWQIVGVVSWGIGCGQYGVPGVYVKVAHYLDWIRQITKQPF